MWMPPGYMVLHGLFFKLFSFSLERARWLSTFHILGAMFFLVSILRRYPLAGISLGLCGAFLLSRDFVFLGNMARMEGLVLLLVMAGFRLFQNQRYYKALAILSLSPLVHPNGLFFCAGGGLYFLYVIWKNPEYQKCSRSDWAVMILSLIFWGSYLYYIGMHRQAFLEHMAFQFDFKRLTRIKTGGFWGSWIQMDNLIELSLLTACSVYAWKHKLPMALLAVMAFSVKVLTITSPGALYQIYYALFYLLFSLVFLQIANHGVTHFMHLSSLSCRNGMVFFIVTCILTGNHAIGRLESPINYPYEMTSWGMSIPEEKVPYITGKDKIIIRNYLSSLTAPRYPILVQFYPQGDALFFHDLDDGDRLRFYQPTFYKKSPDVHVVHNSRYIPSRVNEVTLIQILFQGKVPKESFERFPVLFQRDDTEKWLYYQQVSSSIND